MKPRDHVLAFDKIRWALAGRPDDKECFWKPATILYINKPHHHVGESITIRFDDAGLKSTNHGHHQEDLRPLNATS